MSKLITPESPLLVPPLLAAEIGLPEAVILQQIHYFCQISKHIKRDGRRWFWKTLKDWGQTLPFLSISTIRRAIANLRDNFKLIDVCRHSEKTWYQANWFTVNIENVQALWNRIKNEQIDVTTDDTSMCSNWADQIKELPSEKNSTQHVGEEKTFEVNWEEVARETESWEQEQHSLTPEPELPQTPRYVDEPKEICSPSEVDPHNDPPGSPLCQTLEDSLTLRYRDGNRQDGKWTHQFSPAGEAETSKFTKAEIAEVCNELRRLRINADECLGVIKKYWENVPGAIAYLKEALSTWKKVDKPLAVFLKACKEGQKPENAVTQDVNQWFEWARRKRIVGAMAGGTTVYTPDGEAVPLSEMMRRYPMSEA